MKNFLFLTATSVIFSGSTLMANHSQLDSHTSVQIPTAIETSIVGDDLMFGLNEHNNSSLQKSAVTSNNSENIDSAKLTTTYIEMQEVKLYPVPATSHINLSLNIVGNYKVTIMDLLGKIVKQSNLYDGDHIAFDIGDLEKG